MEGKYGTDRKNKTVWIQGIGAVQAVEAKDLKVGMKRVYNFGYISEVVKVEVDTLKGVVYVTVREKSEEYRKRHKFNTLLAVTNSSLTNTERNQ